MPPQRRRAADRAASLARRAAGSPANLLGMWSVCGLDLASESPHTTCGLRHGRGLRVCCASGPARPWTVRVRAAGSAWGGREGRGAAGKWSVCLATECRSLDANAPCCSGPRSGGRGRGGGAGPPPLLPAVLGAGAAPEEAPLVDLEALDAAAPERFYLPDAAAFAALADCYAVVDGARLPLHSPVLALQSSVLRQVVLQFCGAGASQVCSSTWMHAHVGCGLSPCTPRPSAPAAAGADRAVLNLCRLQPAPGGRLRALGLPA